MKSCLSQRHAGHDSHQSSLSRRQFLHGAATAAAGLLVAGCQPKVEPTSTVPASSPPLAASGKQATVAIAKADSYDRALVRKQVQALFDSIGGLQDVLAHGNKAAIKVNLTGGTSTRPLPGIPEIESYLTHPEVVRAMIELLRDAGVKDVYVVEAVYEKASWTQYGYEDLANETGVTLVDLNDTKDFEEHQTSDTPYFYDKLKFHPLLFDIDAFVSISKMKCHNTAGVTHTMKNLFGIAPLQLYRNAANDTYRSSFHGDDPGKRVPGIIN